MLDGSDIEGVSDNEVDEEQHSSLLKSMEEMGGKKRKNVQRSEAYGLSEYNIPSTKDHVRLNDLVSALQQNSNRGSLKKKIERVRKRGKILDAPLPKHQQEKIHRTIAYDSTTKEVTKWDSVVEKNRHAEQVIFPLEKPDIRLITAPEEVKKRVKPQTSLELEVAAMLQSSDSVLSPGATLTPAEERALRAMNLAEAQERRQELQKYRALLSYEQAKARRQKKIKSKKFHRILQKEKLKKEEKSLEQMKNSDPEAYLEKLKQLDDQRMEERMSLKHRGGSKYAKKEAIYKKYDDHTREAFQEMYQKSRELTKKVAVETDSSGGEDEGSDDERTVTDGNAPTGGNAPTDESNPWMTSGIRIGKRHSRPEAVNNIERDMEEDMDGENVQEESGEDEEPEKNVNIDALFDKLEAKTTPSVRQIKRTENKKREAEEEESSEESEEEEENLMALEADEQKETSHDQDEPDRDTNDKISMSLKRKQTMDAFDSSDEEEDEEDSRPQKRTDLKEPDIPPAAEPSQEPSVDVDPKKFMTLTGRSRPTLVEGDSEEDDDDEDDDMDQSGAIAEAFAADNVVDDFRREKEEIAERDKPKDLDLSLPGWGDWGGTGIRPNTRKRRRFIIKAPKMKVRKDKDMDNVILHEAKDKAIAKHQVKELPFPFAHPEQFEACIRQPVGNTWNPETSYRKLIEPKVVTRLGSIITPIDKEETFKKQKTRKNPLPGDDDSKKKKKKNSNKRRKKSD